MARHHRTIPLALLLILLLVTLCLLSPTVADTASRKSSTSSSSNSPAASSSSPPSPSSSPAPSTASFAARELRFDRKQKRREASVKRSEQQSRRVSDKAKKLIKKYSEQRKKRQEKDSKRLSRQQKVRERSEAYWTARKAATLAANRDKAASRITKLAKLAVSSPLVQLKERQFEELVVASPRPYWVLVSLTALDKKYECRICELMHNAFDAAAPVVVAYSTGITNSSDSQLSSGAYNTLLSFNATVTAAEREELQREHDDRAKRQLPIYVVELDIENARNVFNVLQLTSAPVIFLLPPSFAVTAPQMANLLTGLSSRYKFVPQSLDVTPRTILDFINGHVEGKLSMAAPTGGATGLEGVAGVLTSVRDRISAVQPVILIYFSIILVCLLLFLVVSIVSFYRKSSSSRVSTDADPSNAAPSLDEANSSSLLSFFLPSTSSNSYNPSASSIASLNFYQLPRLLRTLPLIVAGITFYLFCVSGGMFTIIKDTDSGYSITPTGKWEFKHWISNQYMDQTVIESTVLASLYLALTALFVLVNSRTFYQPTSHSATFSLSNVLGWLSSWLVSPLWLVLAAVFVYLQLVNVYSKKNSYNWGVNWRWLKQVDWQKTIPSPAFHRYLRILWTEVQKRLI